jgi:release factor glutamine methyltransferase
MSTSNSITIGEVIKKGAEYFAEKGIDSPRLTMELLACDVLGVERIGLYLNFDKPLHANELSRLRSHTARRAKKEPLQYIVGSTEFYKYKFSVNESVLIPRPETEQLVEKAIATIKAQKNSSLTVCDIGTGSGCIAISIAKEFPSITVVATDISTQALTTAKNNARQLEVLNIQFLESSILSENPPGAPFDIVVSNPPYIEKEEISSLQDEVKSYEPMVALTDNEDGLSFYRALSQRFDSLVSNEGTMFIEIGANQAEKVKELFEKQQHSVKVFKDYSGHERLIEIKKML